MNNQQKEYQNLIDLYTKTLEEKNKALDEARIQIINANNAFLKIGQYASTSKHINKDANLAIHSIIDQYLNKDSNEIN